MRFRRRLVVLYAIFACALSIVWIRVAHMQWVEGASWSAKADKARQNERLLEARRGAIVDARGVVLAEDEPVFQLLLVARDWKHRDRGRMRCTACGVVHFPGHGGRFAKRCSCQRYRTGRHQTYEPEADSLGRTDTLVRLSPGDVAPIEHALGMPRGELAARAARRIAEIERLVEAHRRTWIQAGAREFVIKDAVRQRREDLSARPHVLATDVDESVVRLIQLDEEGEYRGLSIRVQQRRRYPKGDFAPHLLGFTSKVATYDELGELRRRYGRDMVTPESRVGRRGVERAQNDHLHGKPGVQVRQLDASGSFATIVHESPPESGNTVQLAIDWKKSVAAQEILEEMATREKYYPKGRPSAAFVMLDAVTGEILVLAETPRFDLGKGLDELFTPTSGSAKANLDVGQWFPADPKAASGMDLAYWRANLVVPAPLSMSRVLQVAVEPGSTFKPLIALAMLESGAPLPFPHYTCSRGERRKPACRGCGTVDLANALCVSCNKFFARNFRAGKAWPRYRDFGGAFLQRLGIGQSPSAEFHEAGAGRWLRRGFDFRIEAVVRSVEEQLREEYSAAKARNDDDASVRTVAPAIIFQRSRHCPPTAGGEPRYIRKRLLEAVRYVARESHSTRVAVSVKRLKGGNRQLRLRFEVRALDAPRWYVLRGGAPSIPHLWRNHVRRGTMGINGQVAYGGTVWFDDGFDLRVGRETPQAHPVVHNEDGSNVALGQGPVLVTPLQMARAMAVFANGGRLVTAQAARRIGGELVPHRSEPLGLTPHNLERIRSGMRMVTSDPRGTAYHKGAWAAIPATCYGKTGTAQLSKAWAPWTRSGEKAPAWHHWFVGFAERAHGNPVAFACVFHARTEKSGSGSTAGVAGRRILESWFQR